MEEDKLPSVAEILSLTAKIREIGNAIDNGAGCSLEQEAAIFDLADACDALDMTVDNCFGG